MKIAFRRTVMGAGALLICIVTPMLTLADERAPPKQILSVNLCADQMLIALAPKERIVALGPFARDPVLSFFSRRAEAFPQVRARSEALFQIEADAITVGPFDNAFMRQMMRRRQIEEIVVGRWTSTAEVLQGVSSFADAIDERLAGEKLIAEIQTGLKALQGLVDRRPAPSFLMLHRRGFVGEGGLVSELLEMAGLIDAAKGQSSRFLSVESIIALRPDLLVVSGRNLKAEDRGLELLEHPALALLYPGERRITTPDVLTICGGPSTPALIHHLMDELKPWARRE